MNTKQKQLGIVGLVLLLIIGVFIIAKSPAKKTTVVPSYQPTGTVIDVVTKYLQAQEASVSANQPSPSAWLDTIKPISTPAWYNSLAAGYSNSNAGNGLGDYSAAHSLGYSVKATVSNCAWSDGPKPSSTTSPRITCTLTDSVYDSSGHLVTDTSLPFGWTHSGLQQYPVITVTNQNGNWLVSNVTIEAPF